MMIQQRKTQSKNQILKKSETITELLIQHLLFKKKNNILFYVSYNGEVHTHQLIKKSLVSKNVYVPISETETHSLQISRLEDWDELIPGTYGILEPIKEKKRVHPITILDLIIVPGVAFDEKGHRLGQGGGYYDWLLSNTNTPTIALAFESQIIDSIPLESHDQQVDVIITEKRIITCDLD